MRRLATPEEVANTAIFLVSDLASIQQEHWQWLMGVVYNLNYFSH